MNYQVGSRSLGTELQGTGNPNTPDVKKAGISINTKKTVQIVTLSFTH